MASKFLNLSTDTTLGGNAPSDEIVASQKALKTYIDNNSGGDIDCGEIPELPVTITLITSGNGHARWWAVSATIGSETFDGFTRTGETRTFVAEKNQQYTLTLSGIDMMYIDDANNNHIAGNGGNTASYTFTATADTTYKLFAYNL